MSVVKTYVDGKLVETNYAGTEHSTEVWTPGDGKFHHVVITVERDPWEAKPVCCSTYEEYLEKHVHPRQ